MTKPQQPKNKPTKADIAELRGLLDPDKITHEGARNGSEALVRMSDDGLYKLFCGLFFEKAQPQALIRRIHPDYIGGVDTNDIIAALRRLSVVGGRLAAKIQSSKAPKEKKPKKQPLEEDKPLMPLDLHIKNAKSAKKDLDCLTKMAGLATALEQQFETLYTYPARQAQPFMGVKSVNMVAQTLMATLEKLHRMQMDVGIVEKKPEQMEINMRQAGAFQTYVGEMSADHKQTMIDFADRFCNFVSEKMKRAADAD